MSAIWRRRSRLPKNVVDFRFSIRGSIAAFPNQTDSRIRCQKPRSDASRRRALPAERKFSKQLKALWECRASPEISSQKSMPLGSGVVGRRTRISVPSAVGSATVTTWWVRRASQTLLQELCTPWSSRVLLRDNQDATPGPGTDKKTRQPHYPVKMRLAAARVPSDPPVARLQRKRRGGEQAAAEPAVRRADQIPKLPPVVFLIRTSREFEARNSS